MQLTTFVDIVVDFDQTLNKNPCLKKINDKLATEPIKRDLYGSEAPFKTWQKLKAMSVKEISKNNLVLLDHHQLQYKEDLHKGWYWQEKDGEKNGIGRFVYPDNQIYEGQFKDGGFSGYGRFIYENGDYYIGFWENCNKHGKGKRFKQDGNLIEEGIYKDGELVKE